MSVKSESPSRPGGCWDAGGAPLTDGLILQDNTADEFRRARCRKEHFAIGPPALLGRLDTERVEPPCQGGDGFISRENSLPLGNQRLCNALQLVAHHGILPVCALIVCFLTLRSLQPRRSAQRAVAGIGSVTLTRRSFAGSLMRNHAT